MTGILGRAEFRLEHARDAVFNLRARCDVTDCQIIAIRDVKATLHFAGILDHTLEAIENAYPVAAA